MSVGIVPESGTDALTAVRCLRFLSFSDDIKKSNYIILFGQTAVHILDALNLFTICLSIC